MHQTAEMIIFSFSTILESAWRRPQATCAPKYVLVKSLRSVKPRQVNPLKIQRTSVCTRFFYDFVSHGAEAPWRSDGAVEKAGRRASARRRARCPWHP